MIVILIFLLVAEILSIIGAALWPWGSIIVACIFGGFLFLVCIASVVVPFFVRDEDTNERQTFSGIFRGGGGGGGSAYPSGSARPAAGMGLGLPNAPDKQNQDTRGGGYGGSGSGNNNSGGPNQNAGPGSAYTAY